MRTKAMTKEEQEYYNNKTPIAVYPMGNWGGIEILDFNYGIDDHVLARYNFGEPDDTIHNVKVRYTTGGVAYFKIGDDYIRLDECLAV